MFLLISNCYSAIPTVEGLFRSGSNKKIAGKIVILSAIVNKFDEEGDLKELNAPGKNLEETEGQYVKWIFSRVNEQKIQVIQSLYDSNKMNKQSIIETFFIPHITKKVQKEPQVSRALFYSLMLMYAFNDSIGMKKLFQQYSNDFKENKEIMNQDKINLYNKYRNYLITLNKNSDLKDKLVSPLRPKNEKEREKVDKIINSSMYEDTGQVKLTRKNNRFFWEVTLKNAYALFTNEEYRLKHLQLEFPNGDAEVKAGDYSLINGHYALPRILLF
ncbi:MAG: hypothetical protein OXB84_05860, partial [Halobacteriovoraceae bacterium]|nr:hypothetical protein [Halobacteriovoraceae bacterium]